MPSPLDEIPIHITFDPEREVQINTCINCGRASTREGICSLCAITPMCRPCNTRYSRHGGQWMTVEGHDQWLCLTHMQSLFFGCPLCQGTYRREEGQNNVFCRRCTTRYVKKCSICNTEMQTKMLFVTKSNTLSCSKCQRLPFTTGIEKNPDERLVGYELEFITMADPPVGGLGNIHDDGSLRADRGYFSREFSSSAQRQGILLDSIKIVCQGLKFVEAKVNHSCGFHVHLDVRDFSKTELFRLRLWWGYFEDILFASLHPDRRVNSYTKSVHDESCRWAEDRYRSLNIAAKSKWGTYEVRMHEGTVDEQTIRSWVLFLLSFFRTFSVLSLTRKRKAQMVKMNNRERLIFLFQQTKCPLSLRKYFIRKFKSVETYYLFNKAA